MDLMYEYICESSQAMREIQNNQEEIFRDLHQKYQHTEMQEVILLGSGTSYNAALTARDAIERILKVPVHMYYPVEFTDHISVLHSSAIAIGVSQAGRSSSTIEALQKAKKAGMTTICLSAEKDAPIVENADIYIPLWIGEESVGPKTKGYFGSVAELVLLAKEIAKLNHSYTDDMDNIIADMLSVTDKIRDIAEKSYSWYKGIKEQLLSSKRMIVIGYGACMGAMSEGALKLLEGMGCSVTGYELEEFMHGIYHAIDQNTYILALGMPGRHQERLYRLLQYLQDRKHAHIFVVSDRQTSFETFVYPFQNDELFSAMEYIVPLQVLARKLSWDQGIDCCQSADPDFHRLMESYRY